MDLTPEEIELIEKRRKKKARAAWRPKTLEEWTDAEKLEAFDVIHAAATEHYNGYVTDEYGYRSGRYDHVLNNVVLETLLSEKAVQKISRLVQ